MAILISTIALSAAAGAQTIDLAAGGADPILRGAQAGARAGAWLDQGPLSADSRRDLVMGVPGGAGIAGAVYVWFGGPSRTGDLLISSTDATFHGGATGDLFGTATAVGNILNAEGSSPRALVVGAPGALPTASGPRGVAYVFTGGLANGASRTTADAVVQIIGAPGDRLGAALATGDLNNDTFREIIVGAPGNNRVYVIAGGPSLPATIDLSVTPAAATYTAPGYGNVLAAGDITGDGIYDLLVGWPAGNAVHAVRGRTGSIPSALEMTFAGIDSADGVGTSIRLGDFDSDGITDVAFGAPDADGPGDARVSAGEVYIVWGGPALTGRSLAFADVTFYGVDANGRVGAGLAGGGVNRDSPDDLVINAPGSRNGAGALYVFYGHSRRSSIGTARPDGSRVVDYALEAPDRTLLGGFDGGTITAVQVFEVTGEGARDVIVGMSAANNNTGAVYFTISPRMTLSSTSMTINGFQGMVSTAAVTVRNISTISITWAASTKAGWLTVTPSGTAGSTGDGTLNITANGAGLAPGTYAGSITITSTSEHLTMTRTLPVSFVVGETQPTPAAPVAGGFPPGATYNILWRHNTEGWLALWQMNGLTMTGMQSLSINRMTAANWKIAGYGDLNGDGSKDIVWQDDVQGLLAVWFLQGAQVVGTSALSIDRADTAWKIRGVGDVTGDGRADLIWQHTDGWLAVWAMNGSQVLGTALLSVNRQTNPSWKIAGAGDLNGDGRADIVWRRDDDGSLAVWTLNGVQVLTTSLLSISKMTDTNWVIVGVQDVNGDRIADLLWEHTDGRIATWWMSGPQVIATSLMNPARVNNPAWRIAGPK